MSGETGTRPAPDVSRLRIQRDREPERAPRRTGPIVIAVLVGLGFLALFGYFRAKARFAPLDVATARVLAPELGGGASSILTASGYVVARRKAGVGPKVAGLLEYLGVEEGSRVTEGQVIGRLQHNDVDADLAASRASLDEARANLGEAEATLDQFRKEFDRARSLQAQGVVSNADFDLADARLRSQQARVRSQQAAIATAEARVRAAEVAVEDTNVRAPFSGTVLTKDAEEGETVAPAAAGRVSSRGSIATMADLASLEVEVDVNESYIARLGRVQPARIVADSFPEKVFKGEIRQVIPTADRQKATVLVKVRILDPSDLLRPDMGAKVTFLEVSGAPATEAHPLPRVTARAVVAADAAGGATRRVWIVENGAAKSARIDVARESGGLLEVRSGLSGGETVITDPPPGVSEGRRVRVKP